MQGFNFNQEEMLIFFAVLVRFSVLIALLPFVGDKVIPMTVKVLLSLAITLALFPALVKTGQIQPGQAQIWGSSTGGIAGMVASEALFGFILSFVARLIFDTVSFGGNLVGTFMGFGVASTYDPHMESQTQIVAQLQLAIAMLIFLAVDGHHLMLRAALDSYRIVGLGGALAHLNGNFSARILEITSEVFKFGIQLAAPVAISLFAVNVAFGVVAKAMPQLNILVLSFAASALVGLAVLFISMPEFTGALTNLFGRIGDWMQGMMYAMAGK